MLFDRRKRTLCYFVIFQLILILSLILNILNKQRILGINSVNPLNKEAIDFDKTTGLEYFYEPHYGNGDLSFGLADERIVSINSDTLNERFEYSIANSDKNFRIITLGDSWTYGLHVNTESNWTEILEDSMAASCENKIEVLNLGVAGYDIQYPVFLA